MNALIGVCGVPDLVNGLLHSIPTYFTRISSWPEIVPPADIGHPPIVITVRDEILDLLWNMLSVELFKYHANELLICCLGPTVI